MVGTYWHSVNGKGDEARIGKGNGNVKNRKT